MLTVLEEFPSDLLEVSTTDIYKVLGGPTLIHLSGRREEPLFVSTLLHGNEDTGFIALQRLMKEEAGGNLPRSLSIFIGNVEAARHRRRRMDDQLDYNRIWLGPEKTPEHAMMQQILAEMKGRKVFASVDIHNNTGINPHYACVNRLQDPFFHLATLFSRTVVYFIRPQGVQSMAFADLCPAVTVECGHVGDETGIEHVLEFLKACLHLSEIPSHPIPPHDMALFHTVATIRVPKEFSFGFGKTHADLVFERNVDHLNFNELPVGTLIGKLAGDPRARLLVFDELGNSVAEKFLDYSEGLIRTKAPLMPSMFTLDREVISQDCFGYIMERMALNL